MIRQCFKSVNKFSLAHVNPLRTISCAAGSTVSQSHSCGTCTCRVCVCPGHVAPAAWSVNTGLNVSAKPFALPIISSIQQRGLRTSGAVTQAAKGEKGSTISGRLFGACVLERYPVIMPEMPAWEQEYQARHPLISMYLKLERCLAV